MFYLPHTPMIWVDPTCLSYKKRYLTTRPQPGRFPFLAPETSNLESQGKQGRGLHIASRGTNIWFALNQAE